MRDVWLSGRPRVLPSLWRRRVRSLLACGGWLVRALLPGDGAAAVSVVHGLGSGRFRASCKPVAFRL